MLFMTMVTALGLFIFALFHLIIFESPIYKVLKGVWVEKDSERKRKRVDSQADGKNNDEPHLP